MLPKKPYTLYHLAFFIHHSIAVYFCIEADSTGSDDIRVLEAQNYRWRFLTTWNMVGQLVYFILALVNDYRTHIGKNSSSWQNFEKYLNYYFTCVVCSLAYFCAFSFWATYHYDREAVFPVAMEYVCPPLLNHCVHTNIVVAVVGEMLAAGKPIPLPSFSKGLLYINLYYWIYKAQFVAARVQHGKWIYLIYNEVSTLGIVGLILFQWAVLMVFFVFSFKAQTWLNRKLKVE